MRELFDELRLRDYLIILLCFIVVSLWIIRRPILSKILPGPRFDKYSIEVNALILEKETIYKKIDTEAGSLLRQSGFKLKLKYCIDSIEYITEKTILYSTYKYDKKAVDDLINSGSDQIPIRVQENQRQRLILKLKN